MPIAVRLQFNCTCAQNKCQLHMYSHKLICTVSDIISMIDLRDLRYYKHDIDLRDLRYYKHDIDLRDLTAVVCPEVLSMHFLRMSLDQ